MLSKYYSATSKTYGEENYQPYVQCHEMSEQINWLLLLITRGTAVRARSCGDPAK